MVQWLRLYTPKAGAWCSLAPVIMINGEAYGNLTPDSAVEVIKNIQKEEGK